MSDRGLVASHTELQLLARRLAAFDQSPLNACKLRALYRTILDINFAQMTNERPDPMAYTAQEWEAYRRFANEGKAPEAHEVVDLFWLSGTVSRAGSASLMLSFHPSYHATPEAS
jgi:hypothetical protein